MQKIQTISKSKNINYGNVEVNNFWLEINDKSNLQEENNNLEQISSVFNDIQDSVICIQTEELNHPEIIKAIFNASKSRNRIYILTNEKDKNLTQLEGACLVRYGIQNIGSFILINPNTAASKGIIFTAPFIETSLANSENIILEFNKSQIKTLFRFFSDNFWNKAEFEIIKDYNSPIETSEPPLDFLPNIKDFCDTDFVKNEISKINSEALISVSSLQTNDLLNFTELRKSVILTSLNNNTELLTSLASENSIFANKNNTSRKIISAYNDSWLIPKTNISNDDNLYALKLNPLQIEILNSELAKKLDNAEFEFHLSKTREELENDTIRLLDINNEIEIKSITEKNTNDILLTNLLSKEEFENQEPEFIDDNVSVKINYNWHIIPFYTPKNSKKAKIYEEWESYQNKYAAFINQIEKIINESDSKSKNIGEKFKRLVLGKKQTISKYKQELDEIKDVEFKVLELSKRKGIIKKVNELGKNVLANLSEIDIKINKSKIEEEIEKLKIKKEVKKTKLELFIEEQEQKLKEKEENKEKLLQGFLEKYEIKKDELAKYKSEWQRKKNKKKEKIAEEQEKLKELQEIEVFDFRKKFEGEIHNKKREIKNFENKIASKEKELEKVGMEQKQNNSSSLIDRIGNKQNNKDKKQNNEFIIPDDIEYLPKVGELFEVGKQKYLEIEFWEDYELAKKETQRLNANLSAKK